MSRRFLTTRTLTHVDTRKSFPSGEFSSDLVRRQNTASPPDQTEEHLAKGEKNPDKRQSDTSIASSVVFHTDRSQFEKQHFDMF